MNLIACGHRQGEYTKFRSQHEELNRLLNQAERLRFKCQVKARGLERLVAAQGAAIGLTAASWALAVLAGFGTSE